MPRLLCSSALLLFSSSAVSLSAAFSPSAPQFLRTSSSQPLSPLASRCLSSSTVTLRAQDPELLNPQVPELLNPSAPQLLCPLDPQIVGSFESKFSPDLKLFSRKAALRFLALSPLAFTPLASQAKRPKCGDVDTCREQGNKKFEEMEAEKGQIIRLAQGISYREVRKGTGDLEVKDGDVVEITYQVLRGSGYYMYSLGYNKEPGLADLGETYRVRVGSGKDVPLAVEKALIGAKRGSLRRVEMPPSAGFETSNWNPQPTTFEGKQRIEGYKTVLYGNGLQPGYNAVLLFEVEVQKIRPRS